MTYEAMKKAAAIAATSMASASVPVVVSTASRSGRRFYVGNEYVHGDAPRENPAERLRAEFDQAVADLRELEALIARAKALCDLAERRNGNWSARPTPEESREIAQKRKALEEFTACLPGTYKTMIDKLERFNLALRGNMLPSEE
jgi:hypothetical protein